MGKDNKTLTDKINETVLGLIAMGAIVFGAYVLYGAFSDHNSDKNAAKEVCARISSDATTEFAAKKRYQSCMKRKGFLITKQS